MNRQPSLLPTHCRWVLVAVVAVMSFLLYQAQISCAADQEAVNLLEKIDPARDTISGTWSLEGKRLITSGNGRSHCVLPIPYSPPAEYRLTAVVERSDETKPFGFGLVVGSKACIVRFEIASCGICYIDGQDSLHNDTTFRGQSFGQGQPYTIECAVRKAGDENMKVTVQVDGKEIIDWTGAPSRLSLLTPKGPHIVVGKGKDRFLWVQSYGSFAVSKLELRPIGADVAVTTLHDKESNPSATREEGHVVNLLEKIDPDRDTIQGTWTLEGNQLVSSNGHPWPVLTIPYPLPDEYTFTAVVERRDGTKYFGIGLVVGSRNCVVQIDNSGVSGINFIDGQPYGPNGTKFQGQSLDQGKR